MGTWWWGWWCLASQLGDTTHVGDLWATGIEEGWTVTELTSYYLLSTATHQTCFGGMPHMPPQCNDSTHSRCFESKQERFLPSQDTISYTTAIDACRKGSLWQEAIHLCWEMRLQHVQPDIMTFGPGVRRKSLFYLFSNFCVLCFMLQVQSLVGSMFFCCCYWQFPCLSPALIIFESFFPNSQSHYRGAAEQNKK